MELKIIGLFLFFISCVSAQSYRACIPASDTFACQNVERDGSPVLCQAVNTRMDCALGLQRQQAQIGAFSSEELYMLAQIMQSDTRVIASIRDVSRNETTAFESVAIVPSGHLNGLEGLRGARYCHPGFDQDFRWSPRVLKTLEYEVAQTDRIPADTVVDFLTSEHIEVQRLNEFFGAACRPGPWSANSSIDAELKTQYPNLCQLCGSNSCNGYNINMGSDVMGVSNNNRHIQALQCLTINSNANQEGSAVAYVAWQHVREFFTLKSPSETQLYSVLCPNGDTIPLVNVIGNATSPCPFVRQPWNVIVGNSQTASEIRDAMRSWFPDGSNPGGNTWQSSLFTSLAGGDNSRIVFEDVPVSPAQYGAGFRRIPTIDASGGFRPQRWCTTSDAELTKCLWVRTAAHILGLSPGISCTKRDRQFDCLQDISDGVSDFIASPSSYGYIARQHFRLGPVKMVQNQHTAATRIAAFVKETSVISNNITRFENLRGTRGCFPEFGGLAYVSFIRAGQERGVLSESECDYARAVGEFFSGACAPGAVDASHKLSDTDFETEVLCSACRTNVAFGLNATDFICSWNYTNLYYGNNGSLACLADPNNDVAFLNTATATSYLSQQGLLATSFRALCRNNSLATTTGLEVDDNCALAFVVDAEVLTRRNDPHFNSLNTLLDTLENQFGYNSANQLINILLFSPFDGISDLLFKDSTIGLTEPSGSSHVPASNYIELFRHLDACTSFAPPAGGYASRSMYSIISLIVITLMTYVL